MATSSVAVLDYTADADEWTEVELLLDESRAVAAANGGDVTCPVPHPPAAGTGGGGGHGGVGGVGGVGGWAAASPGVAAPCVGAPQRRAVAAAAAAAATVAAAAATATMPWMPSPPGSGSRGGAKRSRPATDGCRAVKRRVAAEADGDVAMCM